MSTVTKEYRREYLKRYRAKNPEKIREIKGKWLAKNPDYNKLYKKEYRKRNPEKIALWRLNYLGRKRNQTIKYKPKQCEVCNMSGKICFDHDHKSGIFRGWLCNRCNLILGFADDNSNLLISLANYLSKGQSKLTK